MRTLLCAFAASAVVGAGLSATPAQAERLPAPRQLTVRLNGSGVHAREHLAAGRHRIEVRVPGRAEGLLLLVKPDRGYTRADLRADDRRGTPAAIRRIRQSIRFFGGAEMRDGHTGVLWETLYAGRYWMVGITSASPRGLAIKTVHVHGTPSASAFPRVTAEATSSERPLQVTPRVPQSGRMLIRNEGRVTQGLFLLPLTRGSSYGDFIRWIRHPRLSRPPFRFLGFRSTVPLTRNAGYVLRYRLRPGAYVVMDVEGFARLLIGRDLRHIRQLSEPMTVRPTAKQPAASGTSGPAYEGFVGRSAKGARGALQAPSRFGWPAWAVR